MQRIYTYTAGAHLSTHVLDQTPVEVGPFLQASSPRGTVAERFIQLTSSLLHLSDAGVELVKGTWKCDGGERGEVQGASSEWETASRAKGDVESYLHESQTVSQVVCWVTIVRRTDEWILARVDNPMPKD